LAEYWSGQFSPKETLMTAGNRFALILMAAAIIGTVPSFVGAAERIVLGEYFTSEL